MRYRLTIEAAADLERILAEGVERFGEAQALKYQSSISRLFDTLAAMPRIGRGSERKIDGEFRFPHGRHVVYYRQIGEGVEIIGLIDSRRITDLWGDD